MTMVVVSSHGFNYLKLEPVSGNSFQSLRWFQYFFVRTNVCNARGSSFGGRADAHAHSLEAFLS
jgi:hypothetical protein